ncbi:MAG: LysR family transcriptional regulator [Methylothermaceae bacteria B42]|nr:MAG: LysR family transcriptional regulator [Methylothermaceae bacteria B42]HHJ38193.1 transcriptional activator NhaR [Methylothermaceae bacterium]
MASLLNYKHLYYFWVVSQESSLTRAAERLHLTPQTICGQIQCLEERLGIKLLQREGRGMRLTEPGKTVFDYADRIFALGEELTEAIHRQTEGHFRRFAVGVTDCLPKLIAYRLLQPALTLPDKFRIQCREDRLDNLITGLAAHKLDLILSDRPLPTDMPVKAFNHLLGESGVSFFAVPSMVGAYFTRFPHSMNNAPMLMATADSALRERLWRWFEDLNIHPRLVGEFADSALMKAFGQAGAGIFYAPTVIENEVIHQYQVEVIGRTEDVREHFYVISLEKRLKHPAVTAIHNTARHSLFARSSSQHKE